jgi:hypothetical protein
MFDPPSSRRGAILLGDVGRRTEWLIVACKRCPRRGRVKVSTLIQKYSGAAEMPAILRELASDCPNLDEATDHYNRCQAHFPDLPRLFRVISTSPTFFAGPLDTE